MEGLIELQRALKAIDGQAQRELRIVLNQIAEVVAQDARRRAPVRSGRLRSSIRALSQQRAAIVAEGGAKVPYAGFIDYGNKVGTGAGVGRSDSQRRPFISTGRILYPAFLARRATIVEDMRKGLTALAERNGLKVNGGG